AVVDVRILAPDVRIKSVWQRGRQLRVCETCNARIIRDISRALARITYATGVEVPICKADVIPFVSVIVTTDEATYRCGRATDIPYRINLRDRCLCVLDPRGT